MLNMARELFSGGKRYPGYGSPKNARAYLLDCVKGNIPDYVVKSEGKELVFDTWEALCEKYAKPVFFEKSPQYIANWASLSLLLEWTQITHRNVRIIGLTRNPMAVMYSAQKLFYTDPEERQYSWLELQKNLLAIEAMAPEGTFMHCKYEDLVSNPVEEFSKVCTFIGLSENHQIGDNVHAESLEIWRSDREFDLVLDESVIQMSQHFGYSRRDVEPNPGGLGNLKRTKKWRAPTARIRLTKSILTDRFLKPWILRLKK